MSMKRISKSLRGVSALSLICAIGGVVSVAHAQAPAADTAAEAGQGGDILVTARRREENLLSVPIAITAVTQEQLDRGGTFGLEDLAKATPGLSFQSVGGTYAAPVIRGLAQVDQTAQIGNVGVFFDGVYLPNRSGLEFDLMDLERVEVVKGPQSALYGRNTFSGAINYVSKKPELGKWGGSMAGEVGTHHRVNVQGSLNIPLGEIAALRVFGGIGKFDGTIYNNTTRTYIGGYPKRSVYGASFLAKPTDKLTVRLFGMRKDVEETQAPLTYLPVATNNCGSRSPGGVNGPRFTLICGQLPTVDTVSVESTVARGLIGHQDLAYGTADYDFDFATLTGTASYTRSSFNQLNDQSTNPLAASIPLAVGSPLSQQAFLTFVDTKTLEKSYELRMTAPSAGRFFWSVGGYIYDSKIVSPSATSYSTLANPSVLVLYSGRDKTISTIGHAVFGQFSYELFDGLKLGFDGRYTHEKVDLTGNNIAAAVYTPSAPGHQTYSYFTPRFTIDYDASTNLHFYASAAKGYKIGGFNVNATGLPQFEYKPESNWTYEIGAKGKLFDNKLVYSADIFYVDWTNIQTQMNIPSSQVSVVGNNLGATSKGVELDTTYYFTPKIWLRAAGALLDPKYKKGTVDGEVTSYCGLLTGTTITTPGCSNNVGGNQLARVAKTQFSVTGNIGIPIGDQREAYIRADYSYQSGKPSTSLNNDTQGETQLVNGSIGFSGEHFDVSFWVRNMFDVNYIARATVSIAGAAEGGVASGVNQTRIYPGERRTFGVRTSYKF